MIETAIKKSTTIQIPTFEESINFNQENITILHCKYLVQGKGKLNFLPSTFLYEEDNTKRKILSAYNVAISPNWTEYFTFFDFIHFTLIFEGLSKNCKRFYLNEHSTNIGKLSFLSNEIERNNSDVYEVELFNKKVM
jgi:hypothetical protein